MVAVNADMRYTLGIDLATATPQPMTTATAENPQSARVNKFTPDARRATVSRRLRDGLVFQEALLQDCIEEVLPSMSPAKCAAIRADMRRNPYFAETLKRVTIDVGLLLSLAKTLEVDSDFEDAVGLIADLDFRERNGLVGAVAKAMVRCDADELQRLSQARTSEEQDGDPIDYLYDCMPLPIVIERVDQLLQFVERKTVA